MPVGMTPPNMPQLITPPIDNTSLHLFLPVFLHTHTSRITSPWLPPSSVYITTTLRASLADKSTQLELAGLVDEIESAKAQ